MSGSADPCAGCIYRGITGGEWTCDYLLITGHRRPGPFGAGCMVKTTENGVPEAMRTTKWDQKRAMALFKEGKSDAEIAETVGTTQSAVYNWRIKNRLLRQSDPSPNQPEPVTHDPAPPLSGPVELCLELEGGWARLRARSWEQAARLWEMLSVCVRVMEREGGDV